MRFTIHTGIKVSPLELHNGRKPKTELTNIIKDNRSYLFDWTLNVSEPSKQKPICGSKQKRSDGPYNYGQEEKNTLLRVAQITKKKASRAG